MFVGIFPEDTGDIHLLSSILFFTLSAVAILVIGIALIRSSGPHGLILVLISFIVPVTFFGPWPDMSCAIAEVIAMMPVVFFTAVYGIKMIMYSKLRVK